MMNYYGKHLAGFKPEFSAELQRITYLENHPNIDLLEEETELDTQRVKDEITKLGTIGNIKEGETY
jgi:hypothetical protein